MARQLVLGESERRQQLSKGNFPMNSYVETDPLFELFREEDVLGLWHRWFVHFSDPAVNMALLQNFNLLVQNLNKNDAAIGHLFQHDLFHSMVVQKEQSILEILNDTDLEEESQLGDASFEGPEDK